MNQKTFKIPEGLDKKLREKSEELGVSQAEIMRSTLIERFGVLEA